MTTTMRFDSCSLRAGSAHEVEHRHWDSLRTDKTNGQDNGRVVRTCAAEHAVVKVGNLAKAAASPLVPGPTRASTATEACFEGNALKPSAA